MSTLDEIPLKLPKSASSRTLVRKENPYLSVSKQQDPLDDEVNSPNKVKASKTSITTLSAGVFYGLLSGLLFSASAASVKYLKDLDVGQILIYQYIALIIFSLPLVIKRRKHLLGPHKTTKYWFFLCGTLDAVTDYFCFISFRYLPLPDATVLKSSVPVFITIAARIFLKEKCGLLQVLAILISVLGLLLVCRLPLLLMNRTSAYTRESVIGLVAAFATIASESGVYIVLRKLHDVDLFITLFNFGIVSTTVCAILTFAFGSFSRSVCGVQQYLVVAVGVLNFLCQLALTKALELENAGPVSVLMAAGQIILAFILDMMLFLDIPDEYTIAGTVLVLSSVVLIGFQKWLENMNKFSC